MESLSGAAISETVAGLQQVYNMIERKEELPAGRHSIFLEQGRKKEKMMEINKEIDVICKFLVKEKDPVPVKMQLVKDDGSRSVVSIDEIKNIVHEPPGGNHIIIYRCVTYQEDRQITFEIRYWVSLMKWELLRIL